MGFFKFHSQIDAPSRDVYEWHAREGAFARLQPPWVDAEIISRQGGLETGAKTEIKLKLGPFSKRWIAEHDEHEAGKLFSDIQVEGPFRRWKHTHSFTPTDENKCTLADKIEYELPGGKLGKRLGEKYVQRQLNRLFTYRHRVTQTDCSCYERFKEKPRKSICVVGGAGFIGRRLVDFLKAQGHSVSVLTRHPRKADQIGWNPTTGFIEKEKLRDVEVVVNLAGAGIADRRWSSKRKRIVWDSRVAGTRFLIDSLESAGAKLDVFICASGSGFYGNSFEDTFDEKSPVGAGFLASLCEAWEREASRAERISDRVVCLRMGVVLDPGGGALAKMLPAFLMGLGGRLGSGRQWMSWIALEDWMFGVHGAVVNQNLEGAVNACSPNPITNATFTKALGKVLKRPTVFPVPEAVLKILFGEMAEETLLSSCRMEPRKLIDSRFSFTYPNIEDCLRFSLGRNSG